MTEAELQNCVRNCAQLFGWRFYHPWISVKSARGFPDCAMVRDGRLVFAELKGTTGQLSAHQEQWLAELRKVPGAEVHVWYPRHWHDGTIEEVLR